MSYSNHLFNIVLHKMIDLDNLTTHLSNSSTLAKDVTFANAKIERIHRWFPYLEGFGEKFIHDILTGSGQKPKSIYEPFAGSGTLPVFCLSKGLDIYYSEVNPFLHHLINLKIDLLGENQIKRAEISSSIDDLISQITSVEKFPESQELRESYALVFGKSIYFDYTNFTLVLKVKSLSDKIIDGYLKDLLNISACEALLHCSFLKRAGDIRYKRGTELNSIPLFNERIKKNLLKIKEDLNLFEDIPSKSIKYFTGNAKIMDENIVGKIDMVITSPPYLNGTNYIRNTKLELWFLGYLKVKKDLSHYRKLVVTAGINDVGSEKKEIKLESLAEILNTPSLWYDKRIPKMINDYFFDMRQVFNNMFLYMKEDAMAFIDIGDSIYGGIHIKTDEVLIELLVNEGFKFVDNIKLRERKSKGGELVKQTLIIVKK